MTEHQNTLKILRQDKRVIDARIRDAETTLRELRKIVDRLESDCSRLLDSRDDVERRAEEVLARMKREGVNPENR